MKLLIPLICCCFQLSQAHTRPASPENVTMIINKYGGNVDPYDVICKSSLFILLIKNGILLTNRISYYRMSDVF